MVLERYIILQQAKLKTNFPLPSIQKHFPIVLCPSMVEAFIKHSHNPLIVQELSWTFTTSPHLCYSLLNNFSLSHSHPPNSHINCFSFIKMVISGWKSDHPMSLKGMRNLHFLILVPDNNSLNSVRRH